MDSKNLKIKRSFWPSPKPGHDFGFYEIKRVFLACPGDLMAERSRFPRLLETVNNLRAHSLGFHLQPVGWERVIPSFGRPQSLINTELATADLVVVIFWNRIGSRSSDKSDKTATIEEFENACQRFDWSGRPLVWVYFKKPTAENDEQLQAVLSFRRDLESGKQVFFREFETLADWEEMFREHLVAFLDGLERRNLDSNFRSTDPLNALLLGRFYGEGVSLAGSRVELQADLDGDGYEENIKLWFSQFSHKLTIAKFDKTFYLELPPEISETTSHFHLALKDVTNDGLPEILLAYSPGVASLIVDIWGFNEHGRKTREFSKENFSLLAQLKGQYQARVLEGGVLHLPYGSQSLRWVCQWNGSGFSVSDE